jgi:polyisoprenoid-binding protein YceI
VDRHTAHASLAKDALSRPVSGTLDVHAGHVDVAAGVPRRAAARLDLASVDTGNARRDRDLRGHRFLDVETRPS